MEIPKDVMKRAVEVLKRNNTSFYNCDVKLFVITEKAKEVYSRALNKFGKVNQVNVAIEEYSEAIKELTKLLREQGNLEHLAEELADALIVTEQMAQIFHIEEAIDEWKKYKLDRLEKML